MKRQKYLCLILLLPLIAGCDFFKSPFDIIESLFNSESISNTSDVESILNGSKSSKSSSSSTIESKSSSSISSYSSDESSSSYSKYVPSEGEYDVSQYYDGYYTNFSWTNGEDLINKLHDAMRKNYYQLAYGWDINEQADVALDDFEYLDVIYKEEHIARDPSTRTTGWNKEHAFCASLMTGTNTSTATSTKGRATDYHNLFASDASANSTRGNTNYGEIPNRESNKGFVNGSNSLGSVFEPGTYDKGRVARALFYMATMYSKDNEAPHPNLPKLTLKDGLVNYPANGVGYTEFAHGSLSDLLNWAYLYDVDRLEYQHNEMVCKAKMNGYAQGNRNAYVDFPDLVEYAFGSKKNQPGELKYICPSAEILKINEEGIANYAIKKAKRNYTIGEAFRYSDIELVAVNNDYSYADVEEFEVDIEDGAILTKGNKVVTIHTDKNDIKYNIVVDNFYFDNAKYCHSFATSDIKKGQEVTLSGVNLRIDWSNANASVMSYDTNNNRGVQIGSSSLPAGALHIELRSSFNNISGIYFKCGVASGESGVVKFYIDDVLIQQSSIRYISGKADEAICVLNELKSGVISIDFEVSSKASYIHSIAFDYSE